MNWRKIAEEMGAVQATGSSWKRKVAVTLGKTQGTGGWSRRIVESEIDGKSSWDRAAEAVLKDQ
ncbi:hypothetical protein KYK29_03220 [Shinella daejeonensis]|uniref:hypothetical protein n=1 Tax=Shinella daejeonensis TaxID=659017 RepID=UPI0020C7A928|nr:hypothetical protein [Shinella daejeonensis]MCP8893926.1 hypothetical protein [Shinella daejeonensis]